MRDRLKFLFLNLGYFFDHFFILIIATVVLALGPQWGLTCDALIPYATPCFVMFGLGAVPAGWLADKWSRESMMLVFFLGIGAASILAGFAATPLQLGARGLGKPPIDDIESYWSPAEKAQAMQMLARSIIGAPETVRSGIEGLSAETGADELMVVSDVYDHAARLRSFELIAEAGGVKPATAGPREACA